MSGNSICLSKGLPTFVVKTDHRPLLGIFQKPLHLLENSRLLRMREKLVDYNFTVEWAPGKNHEIADALSRAPVFEANDIDLTTDSPFQCLATTTISHLEAHADNEYKTLLLSLLNHNVVPDTPATKPYMKLAHRLSVDKQHKLVMLDSTRIVVPRDCQKNVLSSLHSAHQGYTKTCKLATQLYYWPNMTTEIKDMIDLCTSCQKMRPALQKMPVKLSPIADKVPMSHVGTDLYTLEREDYLILVDRYSGMVVCEKLRTTSSAAIIRQMKAWFDLLGWPKVIRSDNGPQFQSEFKEFCKEHGIKHELSSPYNSQSNGLAESAVKNTKFLLAKCKREQEDYQKALLNFRNTPRADGTSPAQLFFGRRQQADLPLTTEQLRPMPLPKLSAAEAKKDAEIEKAQQQANKRTRELDELKIGERVICKDPVNSRWNEYAKVISPQEGRSSYIVEMENGTRYVRGRRWLKPCPPKATRQSRTNMLEEAVSHDPLGASPNLPGSRAVARRQINIAQRGTDKTSTRQDTTTNTSSDSPTAKETPRRLIRPKLVKDNQDNNIHTPGQTTPEDSFSTPVGETPGQDFQEHPSQTHEETNLSYTSHAT